MSKDVNQEGLRVAIIGDSGPFSRLGKSIGYSVSYRGALYMIDCGAPLFQALGSDGLKDVRGFFCTHSHDDHKRWFTDISLYFRYSPDISQRFRLITTDTIHEEYEKNSRAALERTLTQDQRRVIEDPYDNFVEKIFVGPRARYRIAAVAIDGVDPNNGIRWRVLDEHDKIVPPSKAKIVVKHHHKANRPRMLFYDDRYQEWVEPESFYHLGDPYFYHEELRPFIDEEAGIRFTVHNAHNWHGPPTVGVLVETAEERFFFTSDTAYNDSLFRSLSEDKYDVEGRHSTKEFLESSLLVGDINEYIERSWSHERYQEVGNLYGSGILLQDATSRNGIVHTDYINICNEHFIDRAILTHSPDEFTSAFPLAAEGRVFRIIGDEMFEDVQGEVRSFDADFYVKDLGYKYVGYIDEEGEHKVVDDGGVLHYLPWDQDTEHALVARVQFYSDIDGHYFPYMKNSAQQAYCRRVGGGIELVQYSPTSSTGTLLQDRRTEIEKKYHRGPFRNAVPAS